MSTTRIEIKPGVFIEVDRRWKGKMGVPQQARVRTQLEEEERRRIIGRSTAPNRKYSPAILEEALRLADICGLKGAATATGVHYETIIRERRRRRQAAGVPPDPRGLRSRYTLEQRLAFIRLMAQLMAMPGTREVKWGTSGMKTVRIWNTVAASKEAGRRLGVDPKYILNLWGNRQFLPPSNPRPQ